MRPPAFGDNVPMTLTADFIDANERHWYDAELLFEYHRWAGADHLYGLSAECGLKAVMMASGMEVDKTGMPPPKYRKHVRELWPLVEDFREQDSELWDEFPDGEPFGDWSHHDRYARRECFRSDKLRKHRHAAEKVYRMVKRYTQDLGP